MKEMIITIVESDYLEEYGERAEPVTSVFRFEIDDQFDYKEMLRELSEHPKCLDAVRLMPRPFNS